MSDAAAATGTPAINIKKYANRRLYNTATSSYVTLDNLAEMIKNGVEFTVTDAKSGEDITRSVLTQIIVEQEGKGQALLPIKFLRQIISFYGDSLGGVVPRYLEHSMEAFAQNEANMRRIMQDAFKGLFPTQRMEEIGKQNLVLFENAMKMFNPFGAMARPGSSGSGSGGPGSGGPGATSESAAPSAKPATGEAPPDLQSLKAELDSLQARIDRLAQPKKGA
ncbi:MAG: polyhydroxyalkanoate synthesis repressor PhaR [Rhodospirillaceae bacterium]|nr:polyhydroxyalkanoate synthesis repressor PhaR [Rhodospirillaceae bacterium]